MKKQLILALLALAVPATVLTARAELFLKDYKTASRDSELDPIGIYIAGAGVGIKWVNIIYGQQTGVKMFCMPSKLQMNGQDYENILNRYIADYSPAENMPIEYLLILGLMDTFPCD